jgi:hypothetical protein
VTGGGDISLALDWQNADRFTDEITLVSSNTTTSHFLPESES